MTLKRETSSAFCHTCDDNDVQEPGTFKCNCGGDFCSRHWESHMRRNAQYPIHRMAVAQAILKKWHWIKGSVDSLRGIPARSEKFEADAGSKWFGLVVESHPKDKVAYIVETTRFSNLIQDSEFYTSISPKRQYPSLVSFVGDCGSGKSTLIRGLISTTVESITELNEFHVPIPGAQSGLSAQAATSGEVNLYTDPGTFGTKEPLLYADCEGLRGGEPFSAKHQKNWYQHGRRYVIHQKNNAAMVDRSTAVSDIYPRFLYMFSDVVCFVTREPRRWTDTAVTLLQWASIGAHHTVNQCALPAAIIVLNGSQFEDKEWISDDDDFLTRQFFQLVNQEIGTNERLRQMAKTYCVSTLKDLFARNFSSVHVHFVPYDQSELLGSPDIILQQHIRLMRQIRSDTARVQVERAKNWMSFDSNQLTVLFHHVFQHLTARTDAPFDFGICHRQIDLPDTVGSHLFEFLKLYFENGLDDRFDHAAKLLASYFVRNAFREEGPDLIPRLEVIFNNNNKKLCRIAVEEFFETCVECSFVDPDTERKCVNTKRGHVKGHQTRDGNLSSPGLFFPGPYDPSHFEKIIEEEITALLLKMRAVRGTNDDRQKRSIEIHLRALRSKRHRSVWKRVHGPSEAKSVSDDATFAAAFARMVMRSKDNDSNTCFGCLFRSIEYRFACGHYLCFDCIKDFNQSHELDSYPDTVELQHCVLCDQRGEARGWPFRVNIKPKLSGLRVLSLDGGGVRGVVEIIVLKRIEDHIGLSLPIGEFFDFIAGTSTGGLIAMGIGLHGWNADTCANKFHDINGGGLVANAFTKGYVTIM